MSLTKNVSRRAVLAAGAVGAVGLAGSATLAADKKKYGRIHKAVEEMTAAKEVIEKAPDVFGGHKEKALEALTTAIKECRAALKYANDV